MPNASSQTRRRPIAITIAGVMIFLAAFFNLAAGVFFLLAGGVPDVDPRTVVIFAAEDSPDLLTDQAAVLATGIVDLTLGLVQLGFGIGFWRIKRWAWVAVITWQALKILLELATVFVGESSAITLIFAIVLVMLLNQSDVRRAFGVRISENEPASLPPIRPLDVN